MITFLFCVFLYFASLQMFLPLFYYYINAVGGSDLDYGFILSITALATIFLHPYLGYLSDKKGAQKIVIAGAATTTISLLFAATVQSVFVLTLGLLFIQLGNVMSTASVYAYVSRIKWKEKSMIPYYRSVQSLAVIIAPTIGGKISSYSLTLNLFIASALGFASVIIYIFYFKTHYTDTESSEKDNSQNKQSTEKNSFLQTIKSVFTNKKFLMICLLFLFIELAYDCINFTTPMLGNSWSVEATYIGAATSAYFLAFALLQVPINNVLTKMKIKTVLTIMGTLSIAICCLFIFSANFYVVIAAMFLSGAVIGSLFTYCTVYASEQAPSQNKGIYMGAFNAIMPITDVCSPIISALMFGAMIKLPFYFAVTMFLLFVIIGFFVSNQKTKEAE